MLSTQPKLIHPLQVIRHDERGLTEGGWLKSYHTFSFGEFYQPAQRGFWPLRVINEDWIAPGNGFGFHPHENMEILTYVKSGRLAHQDSLGNQADITAGELQRMSAGTGIIHSEVNPDPIEPVHLFQIWIIPEQKGLTPGYEQVPLASPEVGSWQTLAAPVSSANGPTPAPLHINQQAWLYRAILPANSTLSLPEHIAFARYWLHVVSGAGQLSHVNTPEDGLALQTGDGLGLTAEPTLRFTSTTETELLCFCLERE